MIMKVTETKKVTEALRPSMPSVKFTALTMPTIPSAERIQYAKPRSTLPTKGMKVDVPEPESHRLSRYAPATRNCRMSFCLTFRPRLRFLTTLI